MAGTPKTAPTIETERLRLRAFRQADLNALHALYADAENLRYWGTDPSPSIDETRRMLRWHIAYHPAQYVLWAVEERKARRLIGMINYHRRDRRERRADVGWIMAPGLQGKGYMTEAGRALLRYLIDRLKIHKVEALIRPDNKPSAALAKRLGFRLEGGPIRDRWWVGERWHSVMLYGLVAGEER
ncbi:MAG TPA: GNAT family N-acetyltransferase [Reyranella sp.]|nr:GNAT family N-acetyltransferase [Reyranella sp.]